MPGMVLKPHESRDAEKRASVGHVVPRFSYCYFVYVSACMDVCAPHVCPVPTKARGGVRWPQTGVPDSWEPPCQLWELNPGLLPEQSVVLMTKPSLQPLWVISNEIAQKVGY